MLCAALVAAPGAPALAQQQVYSFDIPSGPTARVVNAIAAVTDDPILFPYDRVKDLQSPPISGELTVAEALERALEGAGLIAARTESGVITVVAPQLLEPPADQLPDPVAPPGLPPVRRSALPPTLDVEDRVTITGSRITRPGMTTPVPVTVITREDLHVLSPTTLIDAIDQLPQFVNNAVPEQVLGASGSAGQSFLNLRGIGSNRTLILIDGRRIVSSTRRGTTDIGVLPEALVERIEVVTGGASAAYGSDAVAGVVNFVLDKDFQGLAGHAQTGLSERGDYENYEASLVAGVALDPRTRLLLAADIYENQGVADLSAREWHQSWGLVANADPNGPVRLVAPNVVASNYTWGGLITRGPLAGTQFLGDGATAPFNYGVNSTPSVQIGGDGIDVAKERTLSPYVRRSSAFAYLAQEWGPRTTGYIQLLHGRNIAEYDKDGSYMAGAWEATIYEDNPYIPDDVRDRMQEAGVTSFPFARYASKRDLSVGRIRTDNRTLSLTAGVESEILGWRANAYYQYGQNSQDIHFRDTIRVDRVYRAMDAVRHPASGEIVCRSTLTFPDDGCIPTSFFGDGAVSQEARDWILTDNIQVQNVAQHFFEVAMDGEPLSTPAGAVTLALGASLRRETFRQHYTPYSLSDRTPPADEAGYKGLPTRYSNGYPIAERAVGGRGFGDSRVWEVFGESITPVLKDLPLVQTANIQTAVRFAHYEGSGDIWAWKTGLDWRVSDAIRLRGTLSRDVRGGTLAERYDRAFGGATGTDPFLPDSPTYAFGRLELGNVGVNPERADTLTIGAVIEPGFLPGLSLSADYYDIRIHDAISRPDIQTIIDRCYVGEDQFCALISRNDEGIITLVNSTFLNVSLARTSGIDIEAIYETPVRLFGGPELLRVRGLAAIYTRASLTPLDAPTIDVVGQTGPDNAGLGLPDYRLLGELTYRRSGAALAFTGQYIAAGAYDNDYIEGVDISDNTVDARLYVNARASYSFDIASGQIEAYVHVRNVFDTDPPVAPFGGGGFYGAIHAPPDFDAIGRRFSIGASWRF